MSAQPVLTEFSQEIRFAVVMYGGSSLAIYMNGVAQELLRLVRATAERPDSLVHGIGQVYRQDDEVSGSERVYRKLGQMLVRGQPPRLKIEAADSIRTKFVIDVISGTSAGGINGVFLAKALVRGEDLASLRDLWIKTADFANLLNDSQGEGHPQKPPKALVNSPLMYSKLYGALQDMDADLKTPRPLDWKSPYARELDLFTTFTDIQGQTIALKLADTMATEKQHLHTFHFVYNQREGKNHFDKSYNPFLAFAARATSAHQAAFEPVALNDIKLERCDPKDEKWLEFFEDYLQPLQTEIATCDESAEPVKQRTIAELAEEFRSRPLADGGALDNSPFSFAIAQLESREARLPVDRKLLYVEPAPEHPERTIDKNVKPDAVANAVMALSTIPSYQFIRDDIRRILNRNLLIGRVNRILMGIESDEKARIPNTAASAGYHRLRVGETTDELGAMVSSAAGYSADSDESLAICFIVRAWRYQHYPLSAQTQNASTEETFLESFDFRRSVRRLKFVLRRAAELSCFDNRAADLVMHTGGKFPAAMWSGPGGSDVRKSLRVELFRVVEALNKILEGLYQSRRKLSRRIQFDVPAGNTSRVAHPLETCLRNLGSVIDARKLRCLLSEPNDQKKLDYATGLIKNKTDEFNEMDSIINRELNLFSRRLDAQGELTNAQEGDSAARKLVLDVLGCFWDDFEFYDVVSFPILYSTDAGEELDLIDVFRISPEDVSIPIKDETKLAGLSLGHFGALLDEKYRINDIIWGRLDCAERLITLLLRTAPRPGTDQEIAELEELRKELIAEAQEAIIVEEVSKLDRELRDLLGFRGAPPTSKGADDRNAASDAVTGAECLTPETREYVLSQLHDFAPLNTFLKNFRNLHEQDNAKLLHAAGRGSHILGKILDDVANQHGLSNPLVTWTTRLLRLFWGFVEVSLPESILNLIALHIVKLLYFLEAIVLVVAIVSGKGVFYASAAIAVTLIVNSIILLLGDVMRRKHPLLRAVAYLGGAVLVFSSFIGLAVIAWLLGLAPEVGKLIEYISKVLS